MSAQRVSIDDLADAIMHELQVYSDEVAEEIKDGVRQVAKDCAKEIKDKSPINSGDYKKGWKTKVAFENREVIRVTVYNSKKPQITHLLEYGHASRNGGRVEGHAHIRPAELQAEKALMKVIEEAVK